MAQMFLTKEHIGLTVCRTGQNIGAKGEVGVVLDVTNLDCYIVRPWTGSRDYLVRDIYRQDRNPQDFFLVPSRYILLQNAQIINYLGKLYMKSKVYNDRWVINE